MKVSMLRMAGLLVLVSFASPWGCDAGAGAGPEAGPDGQVAISSGAAVTESPDPGTVGEASTRRLDRATPYGDGVARAETATATMSRSGPLAYEGDLFVSTAEAPPRSVVRDECCTDPGQAGECWMQDAENDGVTCEDNLDCIDTCNVGEGLCACDDDDDCNDGIDHFGYCDTDNGVCGPSYCNGYLVCSCWGGCVDANLGPYATPQEMCTDVDSGYPGFCCEGTYTIFNPDEQGSGYCSNDPTCSQGCTVPAECDDGNPCTADDCINGGCVNLNLHGDLDAVPEAAACVFDPDPWATELMSEDCARPRCTLGLCDVEDNWRVGLACTDPPEDDPVGYHDDCWHRECGSDGICYVIIDDGAACDDGNECSNATCDASAQCISAPLGSPLNDCCDPGDPDTYDDGAECTVDSCDATYHDVNDPVGVCTQDSDCPSGDCDEALGLCFCPTDADHPDDCCGWWRCSDVGTCIEYHHAAPNSVNCSATSPQCAAYGGGPGGADSECGEWTCNANGSCTEKTAAFNGDPCPTMALPETDDCCGWWRCDDGACEEVSAAFGVPCDENQTGQDPPCDLGGAVTDCQYWVCQGDGTCDIEYNALGTPCPTMALPDEDDCCGTWACDGNGSCDETTAIYDGTVCDDGQTGQDPPCDLGGADSWCVDWVCDSGTCTRIVHTDLDCSSDVGGPGGANGPCGTWDCEASGLCTQDALPDGTPCAVGDPADICDDMECSSGACNTYTNPPGTDCDPPGGGDECSSYTCTAGHTCGNETNMFPPAMTGQYDTCNGYGMGNLDPDGTTSRSRTGDTACAADDYDVSSAGRFSSCNVTDYADKIYNYSETTNDEYQLRHTRVTLEVQDAGGNGYSDIEDWDPVIYSFTEDLSDCGDPAQQYTCNDDCTFASTNMAAGTCSTVAATDSMITTGPWGLLDYTDSDETDGYWTEDTYEVSVAVDSKACTTDPPCPPGGEFGLGITLENHENDDCRNTGAYVAAPIIDGGNYWKERWRGHNFGHDNFFQSQGKPGPSCWIGGAYTAFDPSTAFFRVELPNGADTMDLIVDPTVTELDWDHTYKVYVDPYGLNSTSMVLSFWGTGNLDDGPTQCTTAIATENLCVNGSNTEWYPRERIIRTGDAWRRGWVAVSNYNGSTSGEYELNVIRAPRKFVTMAKIYAGRPTTDVGCCSGANHDFSDEMDLEGYRLDFVPTNDQVYGYAVMASQPGAGSLDNGWLVDPQRNWGKLLHQEICSGKGCTSLGTGGPQREIGFEVPYAGDFYKYYCVNGAGFVAFRKNAMDDCPAWDYRPNSAKLIPHWDAANPDHYGPVLSVLWGNLMPCYQAGHYCEVANPAWLPGCAIHAWDKDTCSCDAAGNIVSDLVRFEGTTARVISWDGFQGVVEPSNSRARNNSLQFQVVIRIDGRITYFFKAPVDSSSWDEILNFSGWMIGMSGSRATTCTLDSHCDSLGGTNIYCDNVSYTADGYGDPLYEAGFYCMNRVYDYTDPTEVGGSWRGGP